MRSYRRQPPDPELETLVQGRAPVQIDQKVSKFQDRRTRRNRDRSAKKRTAVERSSNDE